MSLKKEDNDQDSNVELLPKTQVIDTLIKELDLHLNSSNEHEDKRQILKILGILGYPHSEQSILHRDANRLGNYDIEIKAKSSTAALSNATRQLYCTCCGLKRQMDYIPLCTNFSEVLHLGNSTNLFFRGFINVISLMVILSIVYSIYDIATNVIASSANCATYSVCDSLTISLGGKQLYKSSQNDLFYFIQSWLGLAVVVLWSLYFAYMGYKERKQEVEDDSNTISPSDFAILAQFMPANISSKADFQLVLDQYYKNNLQGVPERDKTFKPPGNNQKQKTINFFEIVDYNVAKPFYRNQSHINDKQLEKLNKDYNDKLDILRKWIESRVDAGAQEFNVSLQQRNKVYAEIEDFKKKIEDKQKEITANMEEEFKKDNVDLQANGQTSTVFITMRYSKARHLITHLNKIYWSDKIRDWFNSIRFNNRIPVPGLVLTRAPEPQDIMWANIGVPTGTLIKKKLLTATVTLIMLGMSFGIIYGLSVLQVQANGNQIISFVISIVITVINVIIGMVLQFLTAYELNFTKTNYQRSLALKTILAQLVNTIIVPFIVDKFVKTNIYTQGGLAQDIFYLGLSNALVTPLLKIFDVPYFLTRLLIKYYDRPIKKLQLNQQALDKIYMGVQFEIGFEYVYIMNTTIFTVFFVGIQPILSFLAIMGLFFMYWAQRYVLFNRASRPAPGSDIISNAINQILFFCPIIFTLGNLTWPIFLPGGTPYAALIPNLISLGVAMLFFIVPLQVFCECLISHNLVSLVYEDSRIFFTTQYNRLNPSTAKQGYQDYMKFLEELKKKVVGADDEQGKLQAAQLSRIINQGIPPPRQAQISGGAFGMITPFMGISSPMMNPYGGMQFMNPMGYHQYNPYAQPMMVMQPPPQIQPRPAQINPYPNNNPVPVFNTGVSQQQNIPQKPINQPNYQQAPQQSVYQQPQQQFIQPQRNMQPQFGQMASNFGFVQQQPPQQPFGMMQPQQPFGFNQQMQPPGMGNFGFNKMY